MQNRADNNAATVDTWVVKTQIEPGQYGEEAAAAIKKDKIPRKVVPANAVRDLSQIQGKVLATLLFPNQVLTTDMFVSSSTVQATFSDRLGNVLYAPTTNSGASGDGGSGGTQITAPTNPVNPKTLYIAEKVQVLAVDQRPLLKVGESAATPKPAADGSATATTTAPTTTGAALITLRVPTRIAQLLASIPNDGLQSPLNPAPTTCRPRTRPRSPRRTRRGWRQDL